MGDYLPRYYGDSKIVGNILDRESEEFTQLNTDIQDVLNQFFIDTATWGLANWERVCGIPTDEAKPFDQRRSVIKSKLRGIGTVTVSLVKSVAEAYYANAVEVAEDNANYQVGITFVGKRGVPSNLSDIESSLRSIIPAHLGIDYVFTFLPWDELDGALKTWDSIETDAFTWDGLESAFL
jgi:hypothetical protein